MSEEKKVGTAEIGRTVMALKDEMKRSNPSVDRVAKLFTQIYNYDLDQLIKADKAYGGSLFKELDSASKKFKELADVSEKRLKDTKTRFDKLRESDPVNYANARVEVLKKLRPEIENESERIYNEIQRTHVKIEETPAVNRAIPLASKGIKMDQRKKEEADKAKKEQQKKEAAEKEAKSKEGQGKTDNLEKYVFYGTQALMWGDKAFPHVKASMVNLFGSGHWGPTIQKMQSINWKDAVDLAKNMDKVTLAKIQNTIQYFTRVGPSIWAYLGTSAAAGLEYMTTITATSGAVSTSAVIWPVILSAALYEVTFRPQDIEGVIDRAGDKLVKRQEYNLKIVEVARYETMCEVNQRKTFALVKDINLERYTAKYEKLGEKISEGKEIASILKKVPEEGKLYLATILYQTEEKVKAAKGEDFTSSPEYLKFVLKNLKQ
jgi:hypothetical protein